MTIWCTTLETEGYSSVPQTNSSTGLGEVVLGCEIDDGKITKTGKNMNVVLCMVANN